MQGKDVKIIAAYLPQFHRTPENDAWWGEGFTDWIAAKNATPLFPGHVQPKVPLNNNYYSLDNVDAIRWQVELAKKYGVYGFAIYHYWFSSKQQLLTKPAELILQNKDIDTHFMFIWDNNSWKRTWSKIEANDWAPLYDNKTNVSQQNGMLAELIYGDEKEWKAHFDYLLPYFKDERYIKVDNKPIFGFYTKNGKLDPVCYDMVRYWDNLAKEHGFDGVFCMSKYHWKKDHSIYGNMNYFSNRYVHGNAMSGSLWGSLINKFIKAYTLLRYKLRILPYDRMWKNMLKASKKIDANTWLGGFVSYDDTPRRGLNGIVFKGATPQKFQKYLTELLKISKQQGKEYVFVTAWNEWGEGMCLEPDEENGYGYLEALQSALREVNGRN